MMKLTLPLWKHQEQMKNYAVNIYKNGLKYRPLFSPPTDYAFWLGGCRIGKTLAALAVIAEMNFKKTLVLTNKAAAEQSWLDDISENVEGGYYIVFGKKVTTPDGYPKGLDNATKKGRWLVQHSEINDNLIVVINYESARLMSEYLSKIPFDFVIADESHKLKTYNSKQSKVLTQTFLNTPYKLIMTGTAFDDRPTDVYGQVRFCDAYTDGYGRSRTIKSANFGSWQEFFVKHVNYYEYNHTKIPKSYKNLDSIQNTLNGFLLRIDTDDVLDLPEAHHKTVLLPMPKPMKDAYEHLETDMVANIGADLLIASHRLTQALRLHQLSSGYYKTEEGEYKPLVKDSDNPKLQALLEILDEIDGKPIVVFTRFSYDVDLIASALDKLKITYKKLIGGLHEHSEWQKGEGQVLLANIQTGSTGINLNRARYCVYYSVGYSRTEYTQSLFRIRAQPDPTHPVSYWHLCIQDSVDVEIQHGLEGKGDMADYLLKGLVNRISK